MAVFWVVAPRSLVRTIALMVEAARNYETSVNFYRTTRRNNPEDNHLHIRRRENLKSHRVFSLRHSASRLMGTMGPFVEGKATGA
jgi:hypothetical protein